MYAKRYAPYDWKKQAVKFDLFDIKPWIDRALKAKDDLEFFEIEAEYVASLQDTHSSFLMNTNFRATLGMTVDIYDGKVLIDSITRQVLPEAAYPFQIGDEIVSVDGVSAEDWIKRISTWRKYGNPVSTRRVAAQQITIRSQSTFPRAIEIGESAAVKIRRASGTVEDYTIRWTKTGTPFTTVGPVPFPKPNPSTLTADRLSTEPDYLAFLDEFHNYSLPLNDPIRGYVNGISSPLPVFRAGLPSNFVQRLGRSPNDFQYSGTYVSNGLTLGYLRVPSFSPLSMSAAVTELRNEIDYLQKNTDGLIVDVTRNGGGGCYMLDLAAALTPYPFYFFGEQLRPTQGLLASFQAQLENARSARAEQWIIDTYQSFVDQLKAALSANRGMTPPIPACRQFAQTSAPIINDNAPSPVVYTKPMIVLIDEFSISAADIFPSMIQDNKRALLVGARTSGGGGSVSQWPTGMYSESFSNNTNSLVVRKRAITTAEYPPAPYVENIGARPDIPLDMMTRDNLVNSWRTYVDQFTQIEGGEIRKAQSKTPFTMQNGGGVTRTTAGASGQSVAGYGRIEANSGSTTPNGLAIFGFRQNNVLVTEAGVPATAAISSGRIYAEISGSVNTGIAIANPNNVPAAVSFYFTTAGGNSGSGSTTIAANGQLAAFLDQAPFNGTKPLTGTFTFSSSVPVAVTALRGLTNERGDFLITTLPVASISGTAATGAVVFPHYANGDGWTTQIILVNPTDSALAGTIQFLDQQGQTASTSAYSVPVRTSYTLNTSGTPQPAQSGSVRVVPATNSAAPAGLAVFSYRKDGITVTEAGVSAVSSGSAFRMYVEAYASSIQSGVAITTLSNAQATVRLELTRLDGSSTGLTGTLVVPANGQVAQFLNQIPPFAVLTQPPTLQEFTFQGVLRISSSSPISVVGLRGRYNERNDFLITTTPAADEAAAATDAELFFPHFAEAGGFSTQFILFSNSPGQRSGTIRFVSQSGGVLNLTLR